MGSLGLLFLRTSVQCRGSAIIDFGDVGREEKTQPGKKRKEGLFAPMNKILSIFLLWFTRMGTVQTGQTYRRQKAKNQGDQTQDHVHFHILFSNVAHSIATPPPHTHTLPMRWSRLAYFFLRQNEGAAESATFRISLY